jgi:YegS/Rv2252/BmrU family lipid kinase
VYLGNGFAMKIYVNLQFHLLVMEKKKILFVVNPIAGKGRKELFPSWVDSLLDKSVYDYELCYTKGKGHAKQLADQAVKEGIDIVAAVGGDGTVNEVAQSMINSECTMAIVPFGSGNGLARMLKLSLQPQRVIKNVINKGRSKYIDTALVNGVPFVSIAGFGLDAETADAFARDGHRGFLTYSKIAVEKYFHAQIDSCTITLNDNVTFDSRPLMVTFANSNQFGYEAKIAPKAMLDDGLLDVCILKKPILPAAPFVATQLLAGQIHHSPYFQSLQAKKILVRRKKDAVVNIDGEPIMMDKDLLVEVKPLSLKILF